MAGASGDMVEWTRDDACFLVADPGLTMANQSLRNLTFV